MQQLKELASKNLEEWKFRFCAHVYESVSGTEEKRSVACFDDREVANVTAKTIDGLVEEAFVLTNGRDSFLITNKPWVEFLDHKHGVEFAKRRILAKLTLDEQKLLGLIVDPADSQ